MRALLLVMMLCGVAHAQPRAIALVVDRGMPASKQALVQQAIADTSFGDSDRVAVITYGAKAKVLVPLGKKQAFAIEPVTGGTNLLAGLESALAQLKNSQLVKQAIVITDGDSTLGVAPLIAKMRTAGITVSAIGVESMNERALATIASAGKGRHYKVEDATALAKAVQSEAKRLPPSEETYAFVLVIDRAAGMQGVKLEAAKEAARIVLEIADPRDVVAALATDSSGAATVVSPQRAQNRMRMSAEIARLRAGGYSSPLAGLKDARDIMKNLTATNKHVILFSGGLGSEDGIMDVVDELVAEKVIVSAVGVPNGQFELPQAIATRGGGWFVKPDEIGTLPKLFLHASEP